MKMNLYKSIQDQENILAEQNKDISLINDEKNESVFVRNKKKENFKKQLIVMVVIFIIVSAVIATVNLLGLPYDRTNNTFVSVKVEEGERLSDIAQELEEKGIIDNASVFSFLAKIMMNSDFKPGVYFLSPSMESTKIASILSNGITHSNGFTIPKGYTVKQIAKSLGQSGFVDEKSFLEAASTFDFSYFRFIGNENDIEGIDRIEGFLLPDDYKMSEDADEIMVIITMLNQFDVFYNDNYIAREEELSLSTREVIVIATNTKEMSKISAVIHNRRNIGIGDSLPKVPLCSPSKDSIQAALYPEENEDLYYVLSDKLDGTHVFTSSESEYHELKSLYEKARNERSSSEKSKKESK